MTTPWHRIESFAAQFSRCAVTAGQTAVVLTETESRSELVAAATTALDFLGAHPVTVTLPTPPNPGPVPIRSTGASVALAGHPAALAALKAADFVVDCTVEGLLHAPELPEILGGGTRVLMISNEHPEVFDRLAYDPTLVERVQKGRDVLAAATQMQVTSAAGTNLTIDLAGAVCAGSAGVVAEAGDIAHWPGGLVLAFPAAGTVNGTVVMAPGDVNLTFKEYLRSFITLTIENDFITDIQGDGLDAELFASYLAAWQEPEAYAISHVGWGMNHQCRWDALPLYDKADINGTELRAFAGNFLWSTGANETANRFCRGHFDLPMRDCTVALDGQPVVIDGQLVDGLA
jgi:2,5-dihydroxypyridine 5,6-dioxygenase